ncbi:SDR family NAD(P)-dependent oxidoreductase [Microbacterium terregens]|uniref:SDR family NAD(P)-dependent oxidoreductase n=1 Tax=Microbacterium terregens TaxID=69363 RepID=A0ABV5SYY3_9MICO
MDMREETVRADSDESRTVLVVGASRGLGYAMTAEFLDRGWRVIATVRDPSVGSPLKELADRADMALRVEGLDINDPEQLAILRETLADERVDILFVNAGITNHRQTPIAEVPTADYVELMVTNALSPMRVIEMLQHLVPEGGLLGAMSSGMASITNNTRGNEELYRGSKAALNMFMRSFAVRQAGSGRAIVLMTPGWVQTALGGAEAPLTVDESVPLVVDVLVSRLGHSDLEFLDNEGRVIPW